MNAIKHKGNRLTCLQGLSSILTEKKKKRMATILGTMIQTAGSCAKGTFVDVKKLSSQAPQLIQILLRVIFDDQGFFY